MLIKRWCTRIVVITGFLLLHGCTTPVATSTEPAKPVSRPAAKEVVVLVSENIPDYDLVAKALARQLGSRGSVRYLKGSRAENIRMLAAYKDDKQRQFVSIGLKAAVAANSLTDRQVVFCQVFNYQDYDLVTSRHKGVSMIPSMSSMFSAWHALAPDTTDVGVISGPGLEDVLQTAEVAARNKGITLHHEIVNSDMEYQYAYKQMADNVQGYWLLPDNRVLSGNVLRDFMTFSVRNGKQVVVHNKELLNLGALFSAGNDYQDIAQQVVNRLNQAQNQDEVPGADVIYPGKMVLNINSVMAQRLNLQIPAEYKKYGHAF